MSKRTIKSQASSARAASGTVGGTFGQGQGTFYNSSATFGSVPSSSLSYVYEPPPLNEISDPNIVVAFKNVQKKDSTTKAKALEDLNSHLDSSLGDTLGDGVLEAWIKVYPRTSIDSSRRVRQLAHIFQGKIATFYGKRLAKYMPDVVSSWLAGQQDPDKAVSRAAHDSFNDVFATGEKRSNVWRVYHQAIAQYAENVLMNETEVTLSDMRTVNVDDANSKFARVVGCAVTVLAKLIEVVAQTDLKDSSPTFTDLMRCEKFWKLANHEDAFVRRAILRFLIMCLDNQAQTLDFSLLSTHIVAKGLHTSQTGSSLDFVKAIVRLSEVMPTVWTSYYQGEGKKSARHRLLHYLRKGSQGGSVTVWEYIPLLLKLIPEEATFIPLEAPDTENGRKNSESQMILLLEAIRIGITSKDEPLSNAVSAWNAYVDVCQSITVRNYCPHSALVSECLLPLVHQFIRPSPDLLAWTIGGSKQQIICARVCNMSFSLSPDISDKEWRTLSWKLIEDFQTSLPERSKDHTKSQDSIAEEALKWYSLQAAILEGSSYESFTRTLSDQLVQEITAMISVLTTRIGKPYGVARALHTLVSSVPQLALKDASAKDALVKFAESNIPHLLTSPSAIHLVRFLDVMEEHIELRSVYMSCIEYLEVHLESANGQTAMTTLLSSPGSAKAGLLSTTLNKILARAIDTALTENTDLNWRLLMAALQNPSAPKALTDDILSVLTEGLSIERSSQASLSGLVSTTKQRQNVLRDFAVSSKGSNLIAKLLFLSEEPGTAISAEAEGLIRDIESTQGSIENSQNMRPLLNVIQQSFRLAGEEALTIEALVAQAEKMLMQVQGTELLSTISHLFPKPDDWDTALKPFTMRRLNPSLAMANPLGTAIVMVQSDFSSDAPLSPKLISRDQDGRSVLLRILQYVTKLVKMTELLSYVSEDQKLMLFHYIALCLQLAGDNMSISGAMPLWVTEDAEINLETTESIFEAQELLARTLQASPIGLIQRFLALLFELSKGLTSSSFYYARAYVAVFGIFNESSHHLLFEKSPSRVGTNVSSRSIFVDMALLLTCNDGDAIVSFNELLSQLTGQKFGPEDAESQRRGLCRILLMNCLLQRSTKILQEVPKQRLIFYVQHAIREIETASFVSATELLRSLPVILTEIQDIYGSFWAEALNLAKTANKYPWDDTHLAGYYACFKFWTTMANLASRQLLEANDDFLDAWTDQKQSIMQSAIRLLGEASLLPDEAHLPRRIFNELLSHLLGRLFEGSSHLLEKEIESLYPVLASESAVLQQAAFGLLHEQIPSKQEQVSLDRALTKDYEAKLPEELLSLILAPPGTSDLFENSHSEMSALLRSYLLSWILIFDHWRHASNILQVDYAKSLAEGTYLTDLLDLSFAILIDSHGKAIDVSKFEIEEYTVDLERETHSLLSHLYFLCLKFLPTQSKSWWRDGTSRQINIAVKAWTEKYFSKRIIASELDTVRDWAPSQADGDQPLTIKILSSAHEISASIPIDEDSMILAIRLPPSYPLARAEVEGVHRVGVPEKKWVSWVRNTQGQLTIASEGGANAMIDCLLSWRKNVTATMKGQTECAICYSVVGVDRSLPSKVCKTCKNKFHGSCLFRWFSSSNSSSCPLCRNTFTYS